MRRAAEPTDDLPGGDSLLDVIANIVGILVLLVVVVAVRAGAAVTTPVAEADATPAEALAAIESEASDATLRARVAARDASELRRQALTSAAEAERRDALRREKALYAATLRAELAEARDGLSDNDRRSLDAQNAIAQSQRRLEELAREQIALAANEPPPEAVTVVVEPTPIVEGRAERTVSFRLQGGRLAYVPVDELQIELAKAVDRPAITDPSQITLTEETVGPVQGFVADAEIAWAIRSGGGRVALRSQIVRLVLRELTPQGGETPEQAFAPGGYVSSQLRLNDPEEVVVRIMVYEDSFADMPGVESKFRERGYRIAKSLKSDGELLGFSHNGYRSVVQ
ncbi:MAG: hypothetical protein AAF805_10085 [Planctomycetota bacterium]